MVKNEICFFVSCLCVANAATLFKIKSKFFVKTNFPYSLASIDFFI